MTSMEKIRELRRLTGASLLDCRRALQRGNGDLATAQALLQAREAEELSCLRESTGLDRDQCSRLLADWGSVGRALDYLGQKQLCEERAENEPEVQWPRWASEVKPFEDIWKIENPADFVYELSNYLDYKYWYCRKPLSQSEYVFSLLCTMLLWIEMEGFVDLFYQQYSLADCLLVEQGLREIGADRLADLFAEAKLIYIRRNPDTTQEEYENIDIENMEDRDRFDAIGDQFIEKGSQIYESDERLAEYARKHRSDFAP